MEKVVLFETVDGRILWQSASEMQFDQQISFEHRIFDFFAVSERVRITDMIASALTGYRNEMTQIFQLSTPLAGFYSATVCLQAGQLSPSVSLQNRNSTHGTLLARLQLSNTSQAPSLEHQMRSLQKEHEQTLEQLKWLKGCMLGGDMGCWSRDFVTGVFKINDTEGQILGVDPSDFHTIDDLFNLIHPDDLQDVVRVISATVNTGLSFAMKYRIKRPNGETRFIMSRGEVIRDETGKALRVQGIHIDVTDEKRHHYEMEFRAAWLEVAVEASGVGMWHTNLLTNKVKWGARAFQDFGLSEDTQPSREVFLQALHPDDRDRVDKEILEAVCGTENSLSTEFRVLRPDGSIVELLSRGKIERDAAGRATQIHGAHIDVTEFKATQRRLQQFLDSIQDGVIVLDKEQRVMFMNHIAETSLGRDLDYARGKVLWEYFPEICGSHFERKFREVLQSKPTSPAHTTGWCDFYNGYFAHSIYSWEDGFTVVFRNVTEQKKQEMALFETQARFQIMADHMRDLVCLHDPDGTISWASPSCSTLVGMQARSLVGMPFLELVSEEDRDRLELWLQTATMSPSSDQNESEHASQPPFSYRMKRADGSLLWLEMLATPVFDQTTGKLKWLQSCSRDVEERRRVMQELERAKRKAEEADALKGSFLANMSHEIRTPMNGIIGMSELLVQTQLAPAQEEMAQTIHNSGMSLLGIINDILDFSKIEAGELVLLHEPFVLHDCIEGAVDVISYAALRKGVDVNLLIEPSTPSHLIGDDTRLRQVLLNLLSNAVKFTHAGGKVIVRVQGHTIWSTEDERTKQVQVQVSVQDSGIGISSEDIPNLFRRFNQLDASTTRKYGGTGLGLAITKQLVEMMRGNIQVESILGQGSLFSFTAILEAQADNVSSAWNLEGLANKRILAVTSNEMSCMVLERYLGHWGMQVQVVGAEESDLRGVLLRQEMTGWDGVIIEAEQGNESVLTIIRQSYAELPALVVSQTRTFAPRRRSVDAASHSAASSLGSMELQAQPTHAMPSNESAIERIVAEERANAFVSKISKPMKMRVLLERLRHMLLQSDEFAPARSFSWIGSDADSENRKKVPLHILLAEDNALNQRVVQRLLEKLGEHAELASNGAQAVEMFDAAHKAAKKYNVILMDIQMPVMGGIEATAELRRRWLPAEQPYVVALTANALAGDRERFLAQGMDDYVSKPIIIDVLKDALERARSFLSSKQSSLQETEANQPNLEEVERASKRQKM